MKVAVSALGPTLEDRVDSHFGRALYLLVVDSETGEFEAIDNNANKNAMGGAGIGAAELVSDRRAAAVVTGHLGPNAFKALGTAGIPGYSGIGRTVREAVAAVVAGELEQLTEAGEAHAG
ncbi:MAG: NifB/NifX family molybdenum-iron cluster-binding protein [Coriobacteriia bacterium]|nr:NifB/NifX family molybdenum-iron cluster-binding protein [Coriobacteriia bacterium]MBN2841360.1 NifB/NifX family molybdenum-iron cluster-binding protein [Coriobacteriia bacterium]